jgi:fumigallin biosynthesis monooxygenase-like protein
VVMNGRHKATIDGDFVVFLIGMRMNRPWKPAKWWPVFLAMPRMLRYLEQHPEKGLLGYRWGFPVITQYWRSFEDLERFARDHDDPHLEPWRKFNAAVGSSGDVGVFHETYRVRAGEYEAIYVNMPRVGLGAAGELDPVGSASRARDRIGYAEIRK